ncbi:MAG: hypothetical protein KDJ99_24790 [Candidatus Competibacteraceae bacterium]|nr:hypothetical protein [Candidatus Competibacteraceae bacterium]
MSTRTFLVAVITMLYSTLTFPQLPQPFVAANWKPMGDGVTLIWESLPINNQMIVFSEMQKSLLAIDHLGSPESRIQLQDIEERKPIVISSTLPKEYTEKFTNKPMSNTIEIDANLYANKAENVRVKFKETINYDGLNIVVTPINNPERTQRLDAESLKALYYVSHGVGLGLLRITVEVANPKELSFDEPTPSASQIIDDLWLIPKISNTAAADRTPLEWRGQEIIDHQSDTESIVLTNETECGLDNRDFAQHKFVGRINDGFNVATATLIENGTGPALIVTAGHALQQSQEARKYMAVEFNVPKSRHTRMENSKTRDIYRIDVESIKCKSCDLNDKNVIAPPDDDWAVALLLNNSETHQSATIYQGAGFKVDTSLTPERAATMRVIMHSFGHDTNPEYANFASQLSPEGEISHDNNPGAGFLHSIRHTLDSSRGSSGGVLIKSENNRPTKTAIALHNKGGCSPENGETNFAILFSQPKFREALESLQTK